MNDDGKLFQAAIAEQERLRAETDRILREQAPHLSAVSSLASRVRDDAVRLYERGIRSFNDNAVPIVTQSKLNAASDLEREYPFLKVDRMSGGAVASEMTSEYERMLTDYLRAIEAVNEDEDQRTIAAKYTTDNDRARFRAVLNEVATVHAFEPVRPSKQRSTLGNVGEQLSRGTSDIADNLILLANKIAPAATARDADARTARIEGELLGSAVRGTAEAVDPATSRDAGTIERGVMGAARSTPYMVGGMMSQAAGGLPGAMAFSFSQMAPDAYREYREEGFNDYQATWMGGVTGAFESAIEQLIGFNRVFVPKAVKDSALKSVQKRLAELVADRGIAWVGENIEEVGQDLSREAFGSIGAYVHENQNGKFDTRKFTFEKLAETAVATATMLAPGASIEAGRLTFKQPTFDDVVAPDAVDAWIRRNPDVDVPPTLSRDKFTELTGVQRSSGEQRAAWAQKVNAAKPVVEASTELDSVQDTQTGTEANPFVMPSKVRVTFESDLDRALYAIARNPNSKRSIELAERAAGHLGISPDDVRLGAQSILGTVSQGVADAEKNKTKSLKIGRLSTEAEFADAWRGKATITKPEATPGGAVATPQTEIPNEGQAEAEAGRQGNQEGLLKPTAATPGSGDVQTAADLGIAPIASRKELEDALFKAYGDYEGAMGVVDPTLFAGVEESGTQREMPTGLTFYAFDENSKQLYKELIAKLPKAARKFVKLSNRVAKGLSKSQQMQMSNGSDLMAEFGTDALVNHFAELANNSDYQRSPGLAKIRAMSKFALDNPNMVSPDVLYSAKRWKELNDAEQADERQHIRDAEPQEIDPKALSKGDTFEIARDKHTVVDIDPDTGIVTVEDGIRLELAENQMLIIDKGSLERAKAAADDPFAEEPTEATGTIPESPDNTIPPTEPPQALPASGEPFDYFGRPELANPMETKEGRKAGDVVDEAMKQAGEPERLSNETVKREAKARVEADYDALKDRIYTKGLIRDVYDMEVARIILNREYATATTEEAVEAWQKAYRHWRESGTEAARSLQIRQDRILSPLERQQQQIMDMLEGLNPDNEKPQTKVTRESVKRSLELRQKVTEELAKQGIDLNAVLSPDFIRPEPVGDSKEDRDAADVEAKLRTRLRKAYISWINSFKRLEGTGFSTIGPLGSKEVFDSTRKVAAAAIALGVFKFSKFVRSVSRSLGKEVTKAAAKLLADAWNTEVKASKNPKVDRTVAKESDVADELDKIRTPAKAQPKPVNELDHRTFAKIIRAIAIQRGGSVMDAAYAVTVNNMLSAARTFVVNLGGTAAFSTYRVFGSRLFQAMGADFLRSMGLNPTGPRMAEFNHIFRVFIPALRQALQNASLAFETEISPSDPGVTSVESYTRMIGAFGRNPIAQKVGTVARIPSRINLAADEFNKTMSAVLDVTARAYRTAIDEGKTGDDIDTRMAEILADRMSPEWEAAIKYARVGAFQNMDNPLAKAGLAAKRWWGVRWQLFFVLTPANIFTEAMKMSPAAFPYFFVKAMRASKFYKKFAKNDQNVDPLNADDYGSLVTAAIVTGLIYWIIGTDDDEYPWLTGTPSATKSVKNWERNNVPAYSIKDANGKYHSYGWLEPFATTMAFTVDSVREFKKNGALASLGAGVASLWQQSQDKTFLQNIANLTRALETVRMSEDKGQGIEDAFAQYVQDYTTSFTPALWRAIVRASREDFPERTDDYWKGMAAKLGSTDYFPRRDIWGRPVRQPEGPEENPSKFLFRMASPVTIIDPQKAFIGDKVLQRYLRASEGVPRFIDEISRTWTDKLAPTEKESKKKLTDEQYDRYAELAGTVAKRLVEKVDFDKIGPIKGGEKVIDLLSLSREQVRTLLVPQWARGEVGNVDVDYVVDTLWQMHTLSEANKDKPKKPTVNMLSTDDTINRSAQENEAARQKRLQNN